MTSNITSNYWLEDVDDFDDIDGGVKLDLNLIKLAAARRAVSNFVQIITSKKIPVHYNNKSQNLTDGKSVYLSSEIINKEDFDPLVGLALHEGCHILLSDFSLLETLWMKIPREIYDITEPRGISKELVIKTTKFIWNVIEDRYIDAYVYKNAPGYRGYYIALYKKYFYSPRIDTMLKSKMYREPSVDAYSHRICNLINVNTDLEALPDLRKIAELINIGNISRLTAPADRISLAFEVSQIIFQNITDTDNSKSESSNTIDSSGTAVEVTDLGETDNAADPLGGHNTSVEKSETCESEPSVETNHGDVSDISASKFRQIKTALEKQERFLTGNIKRRKITAAENTLLDSIEKSGIVLEQVGKELLCDEAVRGIDCIVVKNLTRELMLTDEFPLAKVDAFTPHDPKMTMAINNGIIMGNKLGSKLLLRNEKNLTKYMRKSAGRIDKRVISELGFDNDRIFCNMDAEQYNEATLHISVDASGSMNGEKWYNTISSVTAICKACSLIENINVSVSFRTTIEAKRGSPIPYVVLAYDSKKDKFSKIVNLFVYLMPTGTTPEGLAFEATMNMFKETQIDNNSYFLNFSDGEPCMSITTEQKILKYSGEIAVLHTKRQIDKIKSRGYEILSYFVQEYDNGLIFQTRQYSQFKRMYGNNAEFINITNINAIANSINLMFLKKD